VSYDNAYGQLQPVTSSLQTCDKQPMIGRGSDVTSWGSLCFTDILGRNRPPHNS